MGEGLVGALLVGHGFAVDVSIATDISAVDMSPIDMSAIGIDAISMASVVDMSIPIKAIESPDSLATMW
jgi:hypothetical protein